MLRGHAYPKQLQCQSKFKMRTYAPILCTAVLMVVVLGYWAWRHRRAQQSPLLATELPMTGRPGAMAFYQEGIFTFFADGLLVVGNRAFADGKRINHQEENGIRVRRRNGHAMPLCVSTPDGEESFYLYENGQWYRLVERQSRTGVIEEALRQIRHRGIMVLPEFLLEFSRTISAIPAYLLFVALQLWLIIFAVAILLAALLPGLFDSVRQPSGPTFRVNEAPTPILISGFDDHVSAITYARDGRLVVACGRGLRIHNDNSGRRFERVAVATKIHVPVLSSLSASPNRDRIAVACGQEVVVWDEANRSWASSWDAAGGSQPRLNLQAPPRRIEDLQVTGSDDFDIRTLAHSPGGMYLIAGGGDEFAGDIRLFRAETLEPTATNRTLAFVASVAFSADGQKVAAGTGAGQTLVFDIPTLRLLASLEPPGGGQPLSVGPGCCVVAFAPTGHRLACATTDGQLRVWDFEAGVLETSVNLGSETAYLAFLPHDDNLLVALLPDGGWGQVSLIDLSKSTITGRVTPNVQSMGAALSPDGDQIAILGFDRIQILPMTRLNNTRKRKGA